MASIIKIQARVVSHINHGEGVYTLVLNPEKKSLRWNPGQFLHLALDDYDSHGGFWPDSRVFSIASHYQDNNITLVYSVKGEFTKRMSQELDVNKNVWLKLPFGDFTFDMQDQAQKDIILIAGGTGLAPFIPYLEEEQKKNSGKKIILVYGVRKKEHILFKEQISRFACEIPNFLCEFFIEEAQGDILPIQDSFFVSDRVNIHKGVINIDYIWEKNSTGSTGSVYFLSGPPVMIKIFKNFLLSKNITSESIKIDEWD